MESASENTAYSVETTLEKDNAEGCPLYDGGKCEICGRNIKSDEVLFVPDMYSEWRCCSVECKEKIEEKLRKDREEELKILARYQG
jgi:hypothetical protein